MEGKTYQATHLRLLIADPGTVHPNRYVAELERAGYQITADVVHSNPEFLRHAASHRFDLCVCEKFFEGWSYLQGLQDLRSIPAHTPLVVITDVEDGSVPALECVEAGAYECLEKDRLYRLILTVRRLLREPIPIDPQHALEAVIRACPLAIIALDSRGCVRMWNPGAERIFGWTEAEVLGQPLPTVPESGRLEFQELLESQLSGHSHSGVETVRVLKSGARIDARLWTAPLRDLHGNINGKMAVVEDITGSKRAAAERVGLHETAQAGLRFRTLLESAPDGIFEVDAQGRIIVANREAERLFRWDRADLIGKPIEALIPRRFLRHHVQHRAEYSEHPVTRPMRTGLDLFALRKDGTEFAVDINLSPVQDEDGSHVMCIVRDVSDRRQAEEQIQLLNRNLEGRTRELAHANRQLEFRNREVERANRLKSEFLASMSHELRTPLNAIIGFSDLLSEQTAAILSGKQTRFLGHIRQGARHLLDLINDILDLSKIEAGRLELRYENFTMADALAEVLSSVRPMAVANGLQLHANLPGGVVLNADRVRFKEILYNLLSNAIKFTPEGGRVWVESVERDGFLVITVGDTGMGIPGEEHGSIFESFRQVGSTAKGVREGTGLGLAITRRLVEQHGGKIWLESEVNQGSRFQFSLPLQGPVPAPVADSEEPGVAGDRSRPLVLVVDDDLSSVELLVSHLESGGYLTISAASSEEGVRLARQLMPDIIVMDVLFPGLSGFAAIEELKRSPATADIPIVIVSVVDERTRGFSLGAAEYLVKPVSKETLLTAMGRYAPAIRPDPVLIVDDEAGSLHLVSHALTEAGYPTLLAQSGEEALRLLSQTKFRAVVLDLRMPGVDGFEVVRQMRTSPELASMPVVVLTSKDLSREDCANLSGKITICLTKGVAWKTQLLEEFRTLLP